MANTDSLVGARPVRYLNGAPWNGKVTRYFVSTNNSVAIAPGSFVKSSGSGDTNGVAGVIAYSGTAGGNLRGVVTEIEYDADDLDKKVLAASTAGYVYVVDDPNVVFEIQEDDGGSALAASNIGSNADVLATAPDTTIGMSKHELDRSTVVTATAQLRLLGLAKRYQSNGVKNAYGDWAKWEVVINEHELKSTAGV